MIKCSDCGLAFDNEDIAIWKEPHGEVLEGCPRCFSPAYETKRCKDCGGFFIDDELTDGLCVDCEREGSIYDE
jgi:hypothetical protein